MTRIGHVSGVSIPFQGVVFAGMAPISHIKAYGSYTCLYSLFLFWFLWPSWLY